MSAPRSNSHGSQVSRDHGSSMSRSHSDMSRSRGGNVSRSNHGGNVSRSNQGSVSRNHGNVSRNDAPRVSRSNSPRPGNNRSGITRAPGNHRSAPAVAHNSRSGRGPALAHNSRPGHGPSVAHNPRPAKRSPAFDRPYLEPRHRPMPSYHYGNHYFGHRLRVLPRGYVTMRIGHRDYYYYDGIYYRPYWLGGYYVCRPPLGTVIASTLFDMALNAIAINSLRNEIERAQYAAELSSIYAAQNADYVVRTSDDYYNTNLLKQAGQDYYYQDGVFYTLKNGEYCVIEAPIGAMVDEIPEDYDEVELGGKTYYQVEDVLYKPTIIKGKLCFEVACNL